MGRPLDKHIDEQELEALASSGTNWHEGGNRPLRASIVEAERHLASCATCRSRVSQYSRVVNRVDLGVAIDAPQPDCPGDIDWHDVADGLWPELKTEQLIKHAARCAHCGPLLRAAASVDEPTSQEEEFLAQLKEPVRPAMNPVKKLAPLARQSSRTWSTRSWRRLMDWKILVPAGALLVALALLGTSRQSSSPISGMAFAQFAARTHEQHLRGTLGLELNTDSQLMLNQWLHQKSEFSLALPSSPETPPGKLPYRIEGARLIKLRNNSAVYIAYQMPADGVSMIVTPVSAAMAAGGVEAVFSKVTFHYYTIQDYKVVTWSVHGLTYALVSAEGNKTQRSCMVCHSGMRDRDLSDTPAPLTNPKFAEPAGQ